MRRLRHDPGYARKPAFGKLLSKLTGNHHRNVVSLLEQLEPTATKHE